MPSDLDAFDDPEEYAEAIAAFRARVPMSRAEWDALTEEARERAFMVSGIAQADVFKQVFEALDRAVRDGVPFDDFREEVGEALETSWAGSVENPAARQETIFRTNLATAYSAGRHRQMSNPAVRRRRPYVKSFGVSDGRQSTICRAIGTVILPADHAWWRTHLAPLHHQCRRDHQALTEDEAKREGITSSPPDVDADPGFGRAPTIRASAIDPDLDEYPSEIRDAVEEKIGGE